MLQPGRDPHQPYNRPPVRNFHREDGPFRKRSNIPRSNRGLVPSLSANNFCVSPTVMVYALEKLGPKVKWPSKMRSDLNTRKSDAFCELHQNRGHKIDDFHAVRLEVSTLLQEGHLKELLCDKGKNTLAKRRERPDQPKSSSPARTINMIIGGSDDTSINGIRFTTTHKFKRSITHERRIMVDDGSGACIINPRVLVQMRLEDKIVSRCVTLIDFNNAVEQTSGELTLHVLAGGMTLETTFHIMDQDMAYNTIMGRPWIHPMRAIPSSLYLMIKFPTPWGIFSIQGEQRTSRECYRIALDIMTTQQKNER
ncbi:PREDICTED: uncharacterized protein LOC109208352 [Nicotiana attenuata]|uniref:uncharacterized protein LOC109208352 n=1 Tax=Nicotiana attenuata TaxID=49451 RepID=UPI000904B117|nr:PREDICTED: uncharacterized protein LOC109208352 [Nicotiana attenuata]